MRCPKTSCNACELSNVLPQAQIKPIIDLLSLFQTGLRRFSRKYAGQIIRLPGSCFKRKMDAGRSNAPEVIIARTCALAVSGGVTAKGARFILTLSLAYNVLAIIVIGGGSVLSVVNST